MDEEPHVEPKPAIILDMNPEAQTVDVGIDIDSDGSPDVEANITIKDKRIWAIISLIVIIVAGTKAAGLW